MATPAPLPVPAGSGDDKRKHLEFIQAIITRMNSNSFLIKGWTVTLVSALFALAARDARTGFAYVSGIVLPVFWGLDAFYLAIEKRYRALYKKVAAGDPSVPLFSLDALSGGEWKLSWLFCVINRTIWPVYIAIAAIGLVIIHWFSTPAAH